MKRSNGTHGHPTEWHVHQTGPVSQPQARMAADQSYSYTDRQGYAPEHGGYAQPPAYGDGGYSNGYPPQNGGAGYEAGEANGGQDHAYSGHATGYAGQSAPSWQAYQQPQPAQQAYSPQQDDGARYGQSPAYHYPDQQPYDNRQPYPEQQQSGFTQEPPTPPASPYDTRYESYSDLPVTPPGGAYHHSQPPEYGGTDYGQNYGNAYGADGGAPEHGRTAPPAYDAEPGDTLARFGGNQPTSYESGAPPELRGGNFDHTPLQQRIANGRPQPHAPNYDIGAVAPGAADQAAGTPQWRQGFEHIPAPDAQFSPYAEQQQHAHQSAYPTGLAPTGGAVAPHDGAYDGEEEEDYEDAPRSGSRKMLIAAALAGSVVVGGGIAFGYSAIFGGGTKSGLPPVVRADAGPAKEQPADPGGRRFPHTDSKLLGKMGARAPDGSNTGQPQGGNSDGGRVKTVTTMTFDRNGRMVVSQAPGATPETPAPTPPAPPPQSTSEAPVPGTTVVTTDGFGPPPAAVPPQKSSAPSVPPAQPPAAEPPKPEVVAETRPPVGPRGRRRMPPLPERSGVGGPRPQTTAADTVPPATTRPVPERTRPQRVAAVAPRPPVSEGANGYVAVLSTQPTRIDALKSYADLQQRYGRVLGSSIPDVQQADLSARGMGKMYRIVVGPPGSREAALKVCQRLRAAGYRGCWVKAY